MLKFTSMRLAAVAMTLAGLQSFSGQTALADVPEFGPRLIIPSDDHVYPALQLGFYGHMDLGEGMHVDQVLRFSHASRMGLERGDLILKVNGRRIITQHDYFAGLAKTGRYLQLLVHDVHGRGDALITYDTYKERIVGHYFMAHH